MTSPVPVIPVIAPLFFVGKWFYARGLRCIIVLLGALKRRRDNRVAESEYGSCQAIPNFTAMHASCFSDPVHRFPLFDLGPHICHSHFTIAVMLQPLFIPLAFGLLSTLIVLPVVLLFTAIIVGILLELTETDVQKRKDSIPYGTNEVAVNQAHQANSHRGAHLVASSEKVGAHLQGKKRLSAGSGRYQEH
jgi:hypothetical protein